MLVNWVIENPCIVNYNPKIVAYFVFCAYTNPQIEQLKITTILLYLFQCF